MNAESYHGLKVICGTQLAICREGFPRSPEMGLRPFREKIPLLRNILELALKFHQAGGELSLAEVAVERNVREKLVSLDELKVALDRVEELFGSLFNMAFYTPNLELEAKIAQESEDGRIQRTQERIRRYGHDPFDPRANSSFAPWKKGFSS